MNDQAAEPEAATSAEADLWTCPTPCDPDCEAACHEVHKPAGKREHDPDQCPVQQAFRLRDEIAEAIPAELTATPHVGIGGARRLKIADAVMPVVKTQLEFVWSIAERMTERHMRFGVLGQPAPERCADWCHLCRVEKAEKALAVEREASEQLIEQVLKPERAQREEADRRGETAEKLAAFYRDQVDAPTDLKAKIDLAETALTEQEAELRQLRRQVIGYRAMKDTYLRECNNAHAELIKFEGLIERLCDDVDTGRDVAKAALTEQHQRAEQSEAAIERIRALHTPVPCECTKCNSRRLDGLDDTLCAHCSDFTSSYPNGGIGWPCPTLKALDQPGEGP